MMHGVLTLLPLLYYQKTTNSVVNRSLASVVTEMVSLNNVCELVKSYTICCIQYDLLTWVINMI